MNIRFSGVAITGAALLFLAGSGSATAKPRPDETTGDSLDAQPRDVLPSDLPPRAPAGYVIVEEDLWSQHHDQPAGEFKAAEQNYVEGKMAAAAKSIRRGASYVRTEGSRAQPADRDALRAASNALNALSNSVENRAVTSFAEVESVFAQAHHAVAAHHLDLARQTEISGDAEPTGIHLTVAAHNLRQQLTWQHLELDHDVQSALDRVEELANQLQQPGAALNAESRQALISLAQIIASHSPAADSR